LNRFGWESDFIIQRLFFSLEPVGGPDGSEVAAG